MTHADRREAITERVIRALTPADCLESRLRQDSAINADIEDSRQGNSSTPMCLGWYMRRPTSVAQAASS